MSEKPRLPKSSDRLTNIGRTGTGKTVAALWHLSRRNLKREPWVAIDTKGDDHINAIENARHVSLDFTPDEKSKGLYVVHPLPNETEALDVFLWRLWARGDIGIFVDEGYMCDTEAFQAILTQGRSKGIPVFTNTQRPVWCSRFLFSEGTFIQCFGLNDKRDRQTVESFVPVGAEEIRKLKKYHSFYYDVGEDRLWKFAPVPPVEEIIGRIDEQLSTKRKKVLI